MMPAKRMHAAAVETTGVETAVNSTTTPMETTATVEPAAAMEPTAATVGQGRPAKRNADPPNHRNQCNCPHP